MKFDELLKSEMEKRYLTNYRLAKMSGVHQTTIANLLEGKKPQAETERKILEALGLDERCLIDETPQKTPAPTNGDGLDESLIKRLMILTPDEIQKVDAFVQGLIANRST